jgi:hypothetical protein
MGVLLCQRHVGFPSKIILLLFGSVKSDGLKCLDLSEKLRNSSSERGVTTHSQYFVMGFSTSVHSIKKQEYILA